MEYNIDIRKLQIITNKLFDHLIKERNVNSVEITSNFYWVIDSKQLYDIDTDPTDLDIGSLKDDLDFLTVLLDPERQPVASQFIELAPLLNYIGVILSEKLAKYGG